MAQLEPLARRVQQRLGGPAPYVRIMERHRPVVKPLREHLVGRIATPLWILLGTVGIVFLIACANVANLFTVRAENRRRDLVVRRALGAGRGDLVRSQVTEALLLAAAGGVAGALIAWAGVPLLVRAAPDAVAGGFGSAPIPGLATARLDLTALLFTAGISVLAACAFGLLPAFRFSGARLGSLQQAGRGIVGRRSFTRDALVVVQTASALVLLVGSALLMRSFWQLSHVDAGYDTKDIFTFQIAPNRPELNDRMSVSQFQYAFMDRLKALPGVESVGFITTLPLDEGAGTQNITTPRIHGQRRGGASPSLRGRRRRVLPDDGDRAPAWPLLRAGRGRTGTTQCDHQPVGGGDVVPWRGSDRQAGPARGRDANDKWYTVIGVVEDVMVDDLRRKSPEPMVYLPGVSPSPAYVMKSAPCRPARTGGSRHHPRGHSRISDVSDLHHGAPGRERHGQSLVHDAHGQHRRGARARPRRGRAVWRALVPRRRSARRRSACAWRWAPRRTTVRWMFVWQGAQVALLGVVVGALAAVGLTRYIQTLLFGVGRLDVAAFAGMSAVMLAVALLASYIPARRASRVDPVVALRAE